MLTYPDFNPVAISLGPISIHWYGIMYIVAFGGAWALATLRAKQSPGNWTSEQISDLVFYGALGAVVGGRLGSVFFYNFGQFLDDPLWLFRVWDGGMSFHGGFLGVIAATILTVRKTRIPFFAISDLLVCVAPIGLFFGRIANFINGELFGRITEQKEWACECVL